ncbi:hypothetical protein FE782_21730 [Paenibacillus antri]|uniref:Uncharacterized protein n=1 Tax=Paenibacillus antri TaxID=2582848 RepID=A0A5R9G7D1_9BACL|nr:MULTISPECIES: hypothetical protein [Paenibacillus]TLS50286.1 hypothetical protein FE782_21730 [Paenibacillus antri]
MQKYNFFRPLIILLVAFATNNLAKLVCAAFGVDPETTESIAIGAMVLAALFTYTRLNRNRANKK